MLSSVAVIHPDSPEAEQLAQMRQGERLTLDSDQNETGGGGYPSAGLYLGPAAIRTSPCGAQWTKLERVALVNRLDSARGLYPRRPESLVQRIRPLAAGHLVRSVETR